MWPFKKKEPVVVEFHGADRRPNTYEVTMESGSVITARAAFARANGDLRLFERIRSVNGEETTANFAVFAQGKWVAIERTGGDV